MNKNCSIYINYKGALLEIKESLLETGSLDEAIKQLYNNQDFKKLLLDNSKSKELVEYEFNESSEMIDYVNNGALKGNYNLISLSNAIDNKNNNIKILLDLIEKMGVNLYDDNILWSDNLETQMIQGDIRNFFILNKKDVNNYKKLQNLLLYLYTINNQNGSNKFNEYHFNMLFNNDFINNTKSKISEYDKNLSEYDYYIKQLYDNFKSYENIDLGDPTEFINYSGGARGADSLWDSIGRKYKFNNHVHITPHSLPGISPNLDSKTALELTKNEQIEAYNELIKIFPNLDKASDQMKLYTSRNYYQVKNADAVYAISFLNEDMKSVKGGANYSVQFSINSNKPTYVFDLKSNSWYLFNNNKFEQMSELPILTRRYAGVGTRDIENYTRKKGSYAGEEYENRAIKAINNIYKNTLNQMYDTNFQLESNMTTVKKIEQGIKTSLIIDKSSAKAITLEKGKSKQMSINRKIYNVISRGLMDVNEAGGLEIMLAKEGYNSIEDIMSKQDKTWFEGKSKMYVYDIELADSQIVKSNIESSSFKFDKVDNGINISYNGETVFMKGDIKSYQDLFKKIYPDITLIQIKTAINLLNENKNKKRIDNLFNDIKCKFK